MRPFYRFFFLLQATSLFLLTTSCKDKEAATETTPSPKSESAKEASISNTPPKGLSIPEGMVYIPKLTFTQGNEKELGTRSKYPEEAPEHRVTVDAFLIDEAEVTNAQFLKFVEATGYKTQAEKGLSQAEFPNAPADHLKPGATVFSPPKKQPELWKENSVHQWWEFIPGADWQHPDGPLSNIAKIMDHPVVCVTHEDAQAYTKWARKRLPTEAEWEAAARGGLEGKLFTWGDEPMPDGKWMANTFQGTFPNEDTEIDGYTSPAPVKSFPPNAFGIYDMAGNVWEHTSDYYRPDTFMAYKNAEANNPAGPSTPIDHLMLTELQKSGKIPAELKPFHPLGYLYTSKGGSFLCHHTYCLRYRPAARHYSEGFSPTNHTGFRCAKDL